MDQTEQPQKKSFISHLRSLSFRSPGSSAGSPASAAPSCISVSEDDLTHYWLISVPCERNCHQTWDTLDDLTHRQQLLSINYKFHIPNFKVGTLDQLIALSDDLAKLDVTAEQVAHRVARYLGEVLEDQKALLHENLLASGLDLHTYVTKFQWDGAKYASTHPVPHIAEIIAGQISHIDTELATRVTNYNGIRVALQTFEKKQSGSLLTRNLYDLVKKDYFITDSDYMETLVVAVPKSKFAEWKKCYEKLTDLVVPRSSVLIIEDHEYGLFTVTIFKRVKEEFKKKARERRFTVRDFSYDEEEIAARKADIVNLVTDKKRQFGPLVRWLKVNFGEAFCAWIHIKALRVFVESVLRYGLPVNFQAILLHPFKKTEKRLRVVLNELYADLDRNHSNKNEKLVSIPGVEYDKSEYFPYVYYEINVNML